jgi:ubiquinone/menaquinone biosynthesis C-methylase UbiE
VNLVASRDSTQRFTGRVDAYRRFRPRYPLEIVKVLRERCGLLSSSVVADVGAGTGMLAELFLQNGNPVFAVEPNLEMRSACSELAAPYAQLSCIDGTAEATGLASESVDFVTAGRAFHWFDQEKALKEFRRVLRPAGWLVLVGYGRSTTAADPIVHEYNQILRANANDRAVNSDRYDLSGPARRAFASGGIHQEMFCDVVQFTWEEFLGNALSLSTTPLPGQADFAAFHEELKVFFEHHKSGNTVGLPIHCEMYVGQL